MPRNHRILLRQGTTTPGAANFEVGEPAWDKLGKKLYIKAEDGTMVEIAGGAGGGGGGGGGNSFTSSETAPLSPLDGDLWLDRTSGILYLYSSDGSSAQWVEYSAPIEAPGFTASASAPSSPLEGDEWLNTVDGLSYRYLNSTWVELGSGGGSTGPSAYEIAVLNGFTGSQQAWLASLVGADGPQGPQGEQGLQGEAAPGFVAGETPPPLPEPGFEWFDTSTGLNYRYYNSEWVEIGAGGGSRGASAYEIALLNGFIGTEAQWLASLQGAPDTSFIASTTAPISPEVGDEWLNLNTGIQYRYISDGNTSQWVETGAGGGSASTGGSVDLDPVIAGMIF